jgi:hypothetical protein
VKEQETNLSELLLTTKSGVMLMSQLVDFSSELVLLLNSPGVSLDGRVVLLHNRREVNIKNLSENDKMWEHQTHFGSLVLCLFGSSDLFQSMLDSTLVVLLLYHYERSQPISSAVSFIKRCPGLITNSPFFNNFSS